MCLLCLSASVASWFFGNASAFAGGGREEETKGRTEGGRKRGRGKGEKKRVRKRGRE